MSLYEYVCMWTSNKYGHFDDFSFLMQSADDSNVNTDVCRKSSAARRFSELLMVQQIMGRAVVFVYLLVPNTTYPAKRRQCCTNIGEE